VNQSLNNQEELLWGPQRKKGELRKVQLRATDEDAPGRPQCPQGGYGVRERAVTQGKKSRRGGGFQGIIVEISGIMPAIETD